MTTHTLRTGSAAVRPASTADRAIGSERKRSITPPCRSVAIPIAVVTDPNATVWMKMPGIRKFTYDSPGTLIAPPNTKRNISTKMTGWMLLNTSTSGVRSIDRRLRRRPRRSR